MQELTESISYPRDEIISVLCTLEEIVVSTDRIGSFAAEMDKSKLDEIFTNFFRRHDIFRKVAQARNILSEPFSINVGCDSMEDLERELLGVKCWEPAELGGA